MEFFGFHGYLKKSMKIDGTLGFLEAPSYSIEFHGIDGIRKESVDSMKFYGIHGFP